MVVAEPLASQLASTLRTPPDVDIHITNDAILEVEGRAIELKVVDTSDGAQKLVYEDGTLANIRLRLDSSLEAGLTVTCVPLARAISIMWWEVEILMLRSAGSHYVRTGMGSVPEHDSGEFAKRMSSSARRLIACL